MMEGQQYTGFWNQHAPMLGPGQIATAPMPPLTNPQEPLGTAVVRYTSKSDSQKKKQAEGAIPKTSSVVPMSQIMQQPVNPYGSMYMPGPWPQQYGYPYPPMPAYGPAPVPYAYPMAPGPAPMQYPTPTPAWTPVPQMPTASSTKTIQHGLQPTSNIKTAKYVK